MPALGPVVCGTAVVGCLALLPVATAQSAQWVESRLMPPLFNGILVADTARERLVTFGGESSSTMIGATYEWDGVRWQQRAPAAAPSPRVGHACSYDPVWRRTLLFGGRDPSGTLLGDTWTWDGDQWLFVNAGAPSARSGHAMAYDGSAVVQFGGRDATGPLAETWSWNRALSTWQLQPTPPGLVARRNHAMTGAPSGTGIVLFGGRDTFNNPLMDSWTWDRVGMGRPAHRRSVLTASGSGPARAVAPESRPCGKRVDPTAARGRPAC